MSAQPLDSRMARLEGTFEQFDKRLDGVQQDLRSLREHVDDGFAQMLRKMDRQFFWLLGVLIVSILFSVGAALN